MEKAGPLATNMVLYVIYFWNKQNIHINLIGFARNFDHSHINVVTFVAREQSNFSTVKKFFVEKTFDRYLLLGLSSLCCLNSRAFWKIGCKVLSP